MFRRRSSKDLSAKIGYDHVTAKQAAKKLDPTSSSISAPPASASDVSKPAVLQQQYSSTSHSRKASNGGGVAAGNIPGKGTPAMSSIKTVALPDDGPIKPSSSAAGTTAQLNVPPPKNSSKTVAPAKQPAEPPAKSLVIGEGVLFEGTTEGCAAAVVGGRLKGTVKSRRLEITRAGKMEGTAIAETAEISGMFEGTLTVTKSLKICSTGRFKGDVCFGSIIVENGGKIEGKVNFAGCRGAVPESSDVPPPTTTAPSTPSTVSARKSAFLSSGSSSRVPGQHQHSKASATPASRPAPEYRPEPSSNSLQNPE